MNNINLFDEVAQVFVALDGLKETFLDMASKSEGEMKQRLVNMAGACTHFQECMEDFRRLDAGEGQKIATASAYLPPRQDN